MKSPTQKKRRGRYPNGTAAPFFFVPFWVTAPERRALKDKDILNYLQLFCSGKKHSKKSRQIEQALRISKTELRRRINRMRQKGIPIASSQDGYYYARTAGEVYATIRQLKTMEAGLQSAISGLEQALDAFDQDSGG